MSSSARIVHVGVLVFPNCVRSSAVVPHDVVRVANQLLQARPARARLRFEAHWVAARRARSISVDGLTFQTVDPASLSLDAMIVPGIDHDASGHPGRQLAALDAERAALRAFAATGGLVLSGCTGTSLVASAGLLDGRRATISWWLAESWQTQFPGVHLEPDALLLHDGRFITAAGVASAIDLALWLVGHFAGDDLRQLAAKVLVTDSRRESQAPYVAQALQDGAGPVVLERARRWLRARLDEPWSVAELARHCRTSERTLLRRFQAAWGMSPVQYVQQQRVERAKALLESTRLSLADITGRCGYQDVSTFSKVFKRWAAATPREYRARFGMRG